MKKLLVVIITFILCFTFVNAEESNFLIKDVKVVKSSDGVVLNDKNNVNATFNDLNQQVKYEAIIHNNTKELLFIHDVELENVSEEFFDAELDTKSQNMMIEPNGSTKVYFYINTITKEGAGRELNDTIDILFKINDKNLNPQTYTNILEILFLVILLFTIFYFINNQNKRKKLTLFILTFLILGITIVYADEFMLAKLSGNISYVSQNTIETTGTVLNGKQSDYTNSKDVWKYANEIKNVYIKSLINEPNKYFEKFDLSQNNDGRVIGYLVENEEKDIPYDLYIMSNGVVKANEDSSFLFSFPNIDKVNGLNNIDFRQTTSMKGMFLGNKNLKKVDIESLEMDNTKDTSFMFYNCNKIEHTEEDFNLENVDTKNNMFIQYLYDIVKKNSITDAGYDYRRKLPPTGKYFINTTGKDKYPIYFYRGEVTDNNIKFANFCWQMVRTTDTGGIKIIYNGVPSEDGSCDNTGENSIIGKSQIYSEYYSPTYMGYMSGENYETRTANAGTYQFVLNYWSYSSDTLYYYSDEVIYEDGIYTLVTPTIYSRVEDYESLTGKYTCNSSTEYTCEKVYYIASATNKKIYSKTVEDGNFIDDYTLTFYGDYSMNNNGTYHLLEKETILLKDYYDNKSNYVGKYVCNDHNFDPKLKTECKELLYVLTADHMLNGDKSVNIIFSNEVTYQNGEYTLVNGYEARKGIVTEYSTLGKNYRYTCLNKTGKCTELYYGIVFTSKGMKYITLLNGDMLENAVNKMNSNKNNSLLKTKIDEWYADNMLNYTSKLEDTIWYNDKKYKGPMGNDKETISTIGYNYTYTGYNYRFGEVPKIEYYNDNDKFTVSKENGNGELTYPVGLIAYPENVYANSRKGYLNIGISYWTMTPYVYDGEVDYISIKSSGLIGNSLITSNLGVRPMISLKHDIECFSGTGTVNDPYIVE